jgi:hypothetical protein
VGSSLANSPLVELTTCGKRSRVSTKRPERDTFCGGRAAAPRLRLELQKRSLDKSECLPCSRESAAECVAPADQLTCTDPCLSAGVRLPRVFDDCFGTSDHAAPLTPPWHHFNSQVSKSDKQKSQNKNKTTQGTTWKAENQSSTLSCHYGNGVLFRAAH